MELIDHLGKIKLFYGCSVKTKNWCFRFHHSSRKTGNHFQISFFFHFQRFGYVFKIHRLVAWFRILVYAKNWRIITKKGFFSGNHHPTKIRPRKYFQEKSSWKTQQLKNLNYTDNCKKKSQAIFLFIFPIKECIQTTWIRGIGLLLKNYVFEPEKPKRSNIEPIFFQTDVQWGWDQILADGIWNGWFSINNPENPPFDRSSEKNYNYFHWQRDQHFYKKKWFSPTTILINWISGW